MDQVGSAVLILAGIGALRTDEAGVLAKTREPPGPTPSRWHPCPNYPLTDDKVLAHFAAVAKVISKC